MKRVAILVSILVAIIATIIAIPSFQDRKYVDVEERIRQALGG